jgi:hypothetical protein
MSDDQYDESYVEVWAERYIHHYDLGHEAHANLIRSQATEMFGAESFRLAVQGIRRKP